MDDYVSELTEIESIARYKLGWNPLGFIDKEVILHIPKQQVYEENMEAGIYELDEEINLITKVLNVHLNDRDWDFVQYEFLLQSYTIPSYIKMKEVSTKDTMSFSIGDIYVNTDALIDNYSGDITLNKVLITLWSDINNPTYSYVWKLTGYILEVKQGGN